jgi:hypothetical protein
MVQCFASGAPLYVKLQAGNRLNIATLAPRYSLVIRHER